MAWLVLDISPGQFLAQLEEAIGLATFLGRHRQGAGFRLSHRHGGMLRRAPGVRRRRQCWPPHHQVRGDQHLPGDRLRRLVLRSLFLSWRVSSLLTEPIAIRIRGLRTQFGAQVIHDDLDLDVYRGEVLGIVGGSGTGKSVLLRQMLGLMRPAAGRIEMLGQELAGLGDVGQKIDADPSGRSLSGWCSLQLAHRCPERRSADARTARTFHCRCCVSLPP